MGVWEKPGQEDVTMLRRLRGLAEGHDANGLPVDIDTQMEAIRRWQDTQIQKGRLANDTHRAESERLRADNDTMRAENDRLRAVAEVAVMHAGIDAQLERLQIEKADVIVRALGVASDSGASAEAILAAIQGLSDKLLTGPEPKAIETRQPKALMDREAKPAEDVPHYERMRRRRQEARKKNG
jgi:hypothetical protein